MSKWFVIHRPSLQRIRLSAVQTGHDTTQFMRSVANISPIHSLHHDERDHVSLDLYCAVALWQQLVVTKERANIVRLTTVEEFDKQSAPGQPLELLVKRLLEINDFQHMEIDDSNTWQTIVSSTQSGLPSSDRNPDPLICHKLVLLPAL